MSETEQNLILAFETSCDETSVSVVKNGTEILSNMIATQVKSHQRFGGVVPEVASRHHVEIITMLITEALEKAGVTYQDLDAVAVTKGPGLVGALLIGISAAKAVAMAYNLPLIGTNHIAGHIKAANLVDKVEYPALALVVSGGHTELVSMKTPSDYEIIGDTVMMLLVNPMIKSVVLWGSTTLQVKQLMKWLIKGLKPLTFHVL